jgi:hypothetical protein
MTADSSLFKRRPVVGAVDRVGLVVMCARRRGESYMELTSLKVTEAGFAK